MLVMAPERVDGDTWASFDAYVTARGPALWRTAWLLTGSRHRAEDLVQEALAKCWSRFDRLNRAGHSFEAYVRTTLLHTQLSWWRRGSWRETPYDELPETPTGSNHSHHEFGRHDLVRALLALPDRQRAVIVLRYVDDLTEEQTADALGISRGAVKQHAHRAIAALRRSPFLEDSDRALLPVSDEGDAR